MNILGWLGISTVLPNGLEDFFIQFGMSSVTNSKSGRIMSAIWIATIWALWQARNKIAFRGGTLIVEATVDLIQYKAWLWIKANNSAFAYSLVDWIQNPWECILHI